MGPLGLTEAQFWRLAPRLLALMSVLVLPVCKHALAINRVLDINGTFPYLRDPRTGATIEPRDYMDFDNLYTPNETYRLQQTAQGRNYHLIKAFDFASYYRSDYWHYSDRDDLVRSAEPVANASRCARQLDWLERQFNDSRQVFFKPGQEHTNLMTLADSFGHPETGTYYGHAYWLGSYHECQRTRIDLAQLEIEDCVHAGTPLEECRRRVAAGALAREQTESNLMRFRYCIAKAHDKDWPTPEQDNYAPRISYKIGMCLPESCETLTFERGHAAQLERLMRIHLADHMRDRIRLHELYCVPDERSPIRQLPTSARLFLGLCGAWLTLLILATCVYSCYKRHQRDVHEILADRADLAPVPMPGDPFAKSVHVPLMVAPANGHAAKLLYAQAHPVSIQPAEVVQQNGDAGATASSKLLLQINGTGNNFLHTLHPSACEPTHNRPTKGISSHVSNVSLWITESPVLVRVMQALSIKETLREFQRPPRVLTSAAGAEVRVNLNALDSIKCLCCVLVIFGHIIFIHMQHLSNIVHTIELSHEIYPRALISFFNFVDTFFIISGMLTAYFIFKRFSLRTFSSPLVWLSISLFRLLRLSPVYMLVFWFIKTTAVYMTHGPIWDYGTDRLSTKGLCIHDHWWKSILYFGNLGSMQPICILPAWSIIVDAQYSLVMPIVIYLIFRNRRLGYLALLAATLISTTKMTIQLAEQTAVKTSDMAKIRLHVYPLISRFAAEFYNTAWNRIGPVAIGIFGGHALYLYESGAIKQWPSFMRGSGFRLVLALHGLIFALPIIGRFTDDPESASETDTTIFIMSNATIKPIWSIINTIFLLRLITDLREHSVLARLMSHNIWHCLGKLCFTSYLVHYEIILTLLKSRQEGLIDPNWSNALREFSAVFLISTLISYIIYILYEAPMNKLITLLLAGQLQRRRPHQGSNQPDAGRHTPLSAAHSTHGSDSSTPPPPHSSSSAPSDSLSSSSSHSSNMRFPDSPASVRPTGNARPPVALDPVDDLSPNSRGTECAAQLDRSRRSNGTLETSPPLPGAQQAVS